MIFRDEKPEARFIFTNKNLTIAVSAVGGGTPGKEYTNNRWKYEAYRDGVCVISGQEAWSGGVPVTHEEMAILIAEYITDELDEE